MRGLAGSCWGNVGRRGCDSSAAGPANLQHRSTASNKQIFSSCMLEWDQAKCILWHCVQSAVSSFDIQAEVNTFLSNTLCIAALMWDLRFSQQCCWKVRGLVQAPTFRRIVVMAASFRLFDPEDEGKLQKWWSNGLLFSTLLSFTIFRVVLRNCDGFSGRSRLGRRQETRKASHNCSEWLKLRACNSEQFRTQPVAWLPLSTQDCCCSLHYGEWQCYGTIPEVPKFGRLM